MKLIDALHQPKHIVRHEVGKTRIRRNIIADMTRPKSPLTMPTAINRHLGAKKIYVQSEEMTPALKHQEKEKELAISTMKQDI